MDPSRTVSIPDPEYLEFFKTLWNNDLNRAVIGQDFAVNYQGRVQVAFNGNTQDSAPEPFFRFVKDSLLERPTYSAFIQLLDNYESNTGKAEVVTPQEEAENWNFIKEIMNSKVMKLAHDFLLKRNKVPSDETKFGQILYNIWFKLYRRTKGQRELDSSGFEHVFVGETRGQEVIGLHNWIQFYLQEKAGNINYLGFMKGKSDHVVTMKFSWKKEVKPVGGMFLGSSPEFEIALFTVNFLLGLQIVLVELGGDQVEVIVHSLGTHIGSAFPKLN